MCCAQGGLPGAPSSGEGELPGSFEDFLKELQKGSIPSILRTNTHVHIQASIHHLLTHTCTQTRHTQNVFLLSLHFVVVALFPLQRPPLEVVGVLLGDQVKEMCLPGARLSKMDHIFKLIYNAASRTISARACRSHRLVSRFRADCIGTNRGSRTIFQSARAD